MDDGAVAAGSVILISAYAKEEIADLIEARPEAGFLSKSDFSADAIGALLSDKPNRL